MSGAPVLTIAIPTFNRNELLARNATRIFEQLVPQVAVLIIDNASTVPVANRLGPLPEGVRLVRNPVNLGGNGNILRCLELCATPWIMLTGDDDCPMPDMVRRMLDDIGSYPEAAILHYSSTNMHRRTRQWETRGRTQFLEQLDSFANLLFVSSSVLRLDRLRHAFPQAQHFAYSCAPHLALLLTAMDDQSLAVFRSASLVDWRLPEVENRGSKFPMALGLPTLLELPLEPRERRLLARHLARFNSSGELLHEALLSVLYGGRTRLEALALYYRALHRLPMRYAPLRLLWGWYLAPMILTPRLSYALVGRIAERVIGRPMGRNNLRVDQL